MKKEIKLSVEPSRTNGSLNRQETLIIDVWEYVEPQKRKKPNKEVIEQLREQKKQIKQAKQESFYNPIDNPYKSIEISIGGLVSEKKRGFNRKAQINQIIKLLKQLQIKYNYNDISRNYINRIFAEYSSCLKRNAKNRILKLVLSKAKNKKERITYKDCLINTNHYEVKLKGEKTTSKIKPIERKWKKMRKVVKFYNFN